MASDNKVDNAPTATPAPSFPPALDCYVPSSNPTASTPSRARPKSPVVCPAPLATAASAAGTKAVPPHLSRRTSSSVCSTDGAKTHSHRRFSIGSLRYEAPVRSHSPHRSNITFSSRPIITFQAFGTSFRETFGYLGIAMVAAFGMSAVSMTFTAIVQVYPDEIGNMLMRTTSLDNGDFLMFTQPSLWMVVVSTTTLVVFSVCYMALIVLMILFRNHTMINAIANSPTSKIRALAGRIISRIRMKLLSPRVIPGDQAKATRSLQAMSPRSRRLTLMPSRLKSKLTHDFASSEGLYHDYYVAMLDFPKLLFQTVSLGVYMDSGFPLPLVVFYACPLAINWAISFYRFLRQAPDPILVITRVFYLLDLFFAVFAPIVVLVYAYLNFNLDREVIESREATLTPGMFDRIAKLFADPVQIQIFRMGFSNLQLTEPYYIAIKSFLNLLGIFKWKKVILHLIAASNHKQRTATRQQSATARPTARTSGPRCVSRRHLLFGAAMFLCCSFGVIIYVVESVVTSERACARYPKCVVFSYVWHNHADTTCSCIVYINRDTMPRTYSQWINSTDVTEQVRTLAAVGKLEALQLVNRAMPVVPDELRDCKSLNTLILLYSKTQRLPEWAKEWTQLRYLHIEGDFIHYPLQYLPSDLFSEMHSLRFVRVAGAASLTEFPSLAGQHQLATLVITIVRKLHELPSFDDLTGLRTLILAEATHVPVLPSLQNLHSLKTFTAFRRNEFCCNGYATGYCDLSNFQCLKRENEPEVQCVDARMSAEDHAVVDRVDGFLCGKNITQDIDVSEPTEWSTDGICEGVLYRECNVDGVRGICYNGRMQVIHCDVFGEYEKMRRLQIARGIGDMCDPKVEGWLGCQA